jgi:Schlafen, AlbA_2
VALDKPIEQVAEADLQDLIENKVSERKTVEYKQALSGGSDKERKEFLADVSSFANTSGGHLVYGMKAKKGVPVELCGLDIPDPDSLVSALDNKMRECVKPRMPGVVVWPVSLANGRVAIVIRVPKSFASPHMVTFGGSSRFHARNSNGKYPLDVDEIRAAFLLSERIEERVRQFRLDRVAKIAANETPVQLREGPKVVLHIVPLSALVSRFSIDLSSVLLPSNEVDLRPIGRDVLSCESRFNLDGLVLWYGSRLDGPAYAYTQVFRNGAIETADTSLTAGTPYRLLGDYFERAVMEGLVRYVPSLRHLGVSAPLAVMLSLIGVKGYQIGPHELAQMHGLGRFDREPILVPEVLLESFGADLPALMRPAFDMIWNAAGWARCPYPPGR